MSATKPATPKPHTASVAVTDPSGHRRVVTLDHLPFRIGRQADNDLVIRDSRTSRHHARITREEDDYFLEDLDSTHGTFLNGERVRRARLGNGDRIGFGFEDSYEITFFVNQSELSRLLGQLSVASEVPATSGGNLAKLRAVVEVARALQSSLSTGEVLDAVVDAALTVTGTERGFLLLKNEDDLSVEVARDQQGMRLSSDDLKVPTRLIHRALKQRRELLSMNFDPAAKEGTRPDMSVANLELRSVVCVPLVRIRTGDAQETMHAPLNETLGLLYLDSRIETADLSSGNRELLQTLAIEASTILENARLLDQEREKQKLEKELEFARNIQQDLLPKQLPTAGWFRVAGSSIASREVGGDYFDAIRLHDDCWSVMVADVSGKGVSSALLASLLQGAFLRGAETAEQIVNMLVRMNRFLLERTGGEKYATLFYSVLSADGLLRWSNAGHCTPVVLRNDRRLESLSTTGMPVGLLDIATYEVETTHLAPGEKVIIYSDGFTEARNEEGRFFDEERLMAALREHAALNCTALHGKLLEILKSYTGEAEQSDDITLVVVEYHPE